VLRGVAKHTAVALYPDRLTRFPGPATAPLTPTSKVHDIRDSPTMSDFLEHVQFLISPSQDHSGDRALERWTSCVRVVMHTRTKKRANSGANDIAITHPPSVSRYQIKVPTTRPPRLLGVSVELMPTRLKVAMRSRLSYY
jgi:hypothetical protein